MNDLILWIALIGLGIGIPLLTLRIIDNWIDRTLDMGRKIGGMINE